LILLYIVELENNATTGKFVYMLGQGDGCDVVVIIHGMARTYWSIAAGSNYDTTETVEQSEEEEDCYRTT
jgi:hypothetical protein